MSDRDDQNNPTIRRLTEEVQRLSSRLLVAESKLTDMEGPFGRILLVKRGAQDQNGNTLAWGEQSVVAGEVVDFPDGRQCTPDDDEHKIIAPGGAEAVLEVVDDGTHRYVPIGGSVVMVRLDSSATGGGKYYGYIVTPPDTAPADDGDLSADEIGTSGPGTSGDTLVRLINLREQDQSTHDLDASGTYLPVVFLALYHSTDPDGTPVYAVDARQSEACS